MIGFRFSSGRLGRPLSEIDPLVIVGFLGPAGATRNGLCAVLLFIAFAVLPMTGFGQSSVTDRFPASPKATAIAEVNALPVGLHTGTPEPSVPLDTVESRTLSLPISLSHKGDAVKPATYASWVGLGWSLQAGGTITRAVRGYPDDHGFGYPKVAKRLWTGYNQGDPLSYDRLDDPSFQTDLFRPVTDSLGTFLFGNPVDTEPDRFYFNLPGHAGRFMMRPGPDGRIEVVSVPMKDLHIEFVRDQETDEVHLDRALLPRGDNPIVKWIVTTADGTRYEFARPEVTEYRDGARSHITAWHLTKVTTARGRDQLTLEYKETGEAEYFELPSVQRSFQVGGATSCDADFSQQTPSTRTVEEVFLEKIESARETIRFYSSEDREDALSASGKQQTVKLDSIAVQTTDAGSGDVSRERSFQFEYGYFDVFGVSDFDNCTPAGPSTKCDSGKRLRLESVQEVGTEGATKPPYRFEYYEDSPIQNRFSKAIDHWGYPNGQTTNSTLLPEVHTPGEGTIGSADRSPTEDLDKLLPGALKSITFPTGGSTTLDYELDQFGTVAATSPDSPSGTTDPDITRQGPSRPYPFSDEYPNQALRGDTVVAFTLDPQTVTKSSPSGEEYIEFSLEISTGEAEAIKECGPDGCVLMGLFADASGANDFTQELPTTSELGLVTTHESYEDDETSSYKSTAKVYTSDLPSDSTFYMSARFYEEPPEATAGKFRYNTRSTISYPVESEPDTTSDGSIDRTNVGGGLRIVKQVRRDGRGNETVRRYKYEGSDGQSSGVLVTRPLYSYIEGSSACRLFTVVGQPFVPLGKTQGSLVGYENVTVLHGPSGADGAPEGGTTTYRFTSPRLDLIANRNLDNSRGEFNAPTPVESQVVRSWKYGLKLSEVARDSAGTRRNARHSQYAIPTEGTPDDEPTRFKRFLALQVIPTPDAHTNRPAFFLGWYSTSTAFVHPREVSVTRYGTEGEELTRKTTTIRHAADEHLQVTSRTETSAAGDERTTTFTYAHEVPRYDGMGPKKASQGPSGSEGRHMLSQRYRTTVRNGEGEAVRRSWTTWAEDFTGHWRREGEYVWGGATGPDATPPKQAPTLGLLEEGVNRASQLPGVDRRITYEEYDAFGQVEQLRDAQGTTSHLQWDKEGLRPTSMIVGSNDYETILQDFEDETEVGGTRWYPTSASHSLVTGASPTSDRVHTGEAALEVSAAPDTARVQERFFVTRLDTTATYVFSAWVHAESAVDEVRLQIDHNGAGTNSTARASLGDAASGGTGWQRLEVRVHIPRLEGASSLLASLETIGSSGAATWDDIQFAPADAQILRATYDDKNRLVSRTGAGHLPRTFSYDGLGRLDTTYNASGEPRMTATYNFTAVGNSVSDDPSFVRQHRPSGTGNASVTTQYVDGLGRPTQTHQRSGSTSIVTATTYDALGRQKRQYRPYRWNQTGSFDDSFDSNAGAYHSSRDRAGTDRPFTELTYDPTPLGEQRRVIRPGASDEFVERDVDVGTVDGRFFRYEESVDEAGDTTRTYTDGFGRTVATTDAVGTGIAATTRMTYDVAGRLLRVDRPMGDVVTYRYDRAGRLLRRTSPDAGVSRYRYDESGQRRYRQNANQIADTTVFFTTYDDLGRPVHQGLASLEVPFADLNPDTTADFEEESRTWRHVRAYDGLPDTTAYPWNRGNWLSALVATEDDSAAVARADTNTTVLSTQRNLQGRLAARAFRSRGGISDTLILDDGTKINSKRTFEAAEYLEAGPFTVLENGDVTFTSGDEVTLTDGFTTELGSDFTASVDTTLLEKGEVGTGLESGLAAWRFTFFRYDREGRVAAKQIFAPDLGRVRISYRYDRQDRLTRRRVRRGSDVFTQWYTYTDRGLVEDVYADTTAAETRPADPLVSYRYNASGQVRHTEYRGSDPVPRRYDMQGRLTAIDSTEAADVFAASYRYTTDGNVEEATFVQPKGPSSDSTYTQVFAYDARGRLLRANYGADSLSGPYDVTGPGGGGGAISYDANGNLEALTRYGRDGTTVDQLTYDYDESPSPNRLDRLSDAAGAQHGWDAGPGRFDYDAAGNLIEAPAPTHLDSAAYDYRNLPLSMTVQTGGGRQVLRYRYSADGQRTYQQGAATTHYLRDEGTTLAVVEGDSLQHWNLTLPSGEVIGRTLAGVGRRYYVKDHLGSIRAVLDEGGAVREARDYYPFGLPLPGRYEQGSPSTEEDFTGHEKDGETGLHYAGARYYSAAFGVWNAVDPLAGDRPGWDPYAYAIGNPVNLMDPNGMEPCPYDESQECGVILPEVVVTAEEPEETADAGVVGGTFYFNSSTEEGQEALRDRLRQDPSAARRMLAQRAARRFSPTAQQIAMEENIYAGQRLVLRIALRTGADLAMVASMLSGAGSAVGVGGLLLERGGLNVGRQAAVRLISTSSTAGLYASGTEAALRVSAIPVGGSESQAGLAVTGAFLNGLPSVPAVRGVNPTGVTGPAFRSVSSGRFVTNSYGVGRYSFVQGVGASGGLANGYLTIDGN